MTQHSLAPIIRVHTEAVIERINDGLKSPQLNLEKLVLFEIVHMASDMMEMQAICAELFYKARKANDEHEITYHEILRAAFELPVEAYTDMYTYSCCQEEEFFDVEIESIRQAIRQLIPSHHKAVREAYLEIIQRYFNHIKQKRFNVILPVQNQDKV